MVRRLVLVVHLVALGPLLVHAQAPEPANKPPARPVRPTGTAAAPAQTPASRTVSACKAPPSPTRIVLDTLDESALARWMLGGTSTRVSVQTATWVRDDGRVFEARIAGGEFLAKNDLNDPDYHVRRFQGTPSRAVLIDDVRGAIGVAAAATTHQWDTSILGALASVFGRSFGPPRASPARRVRLALLDTGGLAVWDEPANAIAFSASSIRAAIGSARIVAVRHDRFYLSDGTIAFDLLDRLFERGGPLRLEAPPEPGAAVRRVVRLLHADGQPARCYRAAVNGFALSDTGELRRETDGRLSQTPVATGVSDVAISVQPDGQRRVLALRTDGAVVEWTEAADAAASRATPALRAVPSAAGVRQVVGSLSTVWMLRRDGTPAVQRTWVPVSGSGDQTVFHHVPIGPGSRVEPVPQFQSLEDLAVDPLGDGALGLRPDGTLWLWQQWTSPQTDVVYLGEVGPGPPSLVDPVTVPAAGERARVLTSVADLRQKPRHVVGVAADGVSRTIVRIPVLRPDDSVSVVVCGGTAPSCNAPAVVADEGGLTTLDRLVNATTWQSSLAGIRPVVDAGGTSAAYVVYRAPIDFARPADSQTPRGEVDAACPAGRRVDDCRAARRIVRLKITYAASRRSRPAEVVVIRPPVVLIHGFNADRSAWDPVEPALLAGRNLAVFRVNYGMKLAEAGWSAHVAEPYFSDPLSAVLGDVLSIETGIRQSHLGFTFVAPCVGDQVDAVLGLQRLSADGAGPSARRCLSTAVDSMATSFREGGNPIGAPVAASQVDVIAHSMGGLVARQLVGDQGDAENHPFRSGTIHKLITLGTPHLGTPQVSLALRPESACSRELSSFLADLASMPMNFSSFSVDMGTGRQITVEGAAEQMRGNGESIVPGVTSPALVRLNRESPVGTVPTALIAGDMGTTLGGARVLPAFSLIRNLCAEHHSLTTNVVLGAIEVTPWGRLAGRAAGEIGKQVVEQSAEIAGEVIDIAAEVFRDPFAARLSRNRYATMFDPVLFPAGSVAPTRSDGSVPVRSAIPAGKLGLTLQGYLHSRGVFAMTLDLAAGAVLASNPEMTVDEAVPHHLLDGQGMVINVLRDLLNESVESRSFNRPARQ